MPNTDITTNWFYKKINVPLVENDTNYIVLLTDYTEESQVVGNTGTLLDIAATEFIKYYFPELWYPLIDSALFQQDMSAIPNSSLFIDASLRNANLLFDIIKNDLLVTGYEKSDRPGSTYKAVVKTAEPAAYEFRSLANPIFQHPEWVRNSDLPLGPNNDPSLLPTTRICPDDITARQKNLGTGVETFEYTSFPYFPRYDYALEYWNSLREVVSTSNATIPAALVMNSLEADTQLQKISDIMGYYSEQIKNFDGQISPSINLDQEVLSLSEATRDLLALASLNGAPPGPLNDIQIIFNDEFQVTSLFMSERGVLRPIVIGSLSLLDSDPFVNQQTMVYLRKWSSILSLPTGPANGRPAPERKFPVFIERISNSSIRTYNIIYCGPSHTAPPAEVVAALASYGLSQAPSIPDEGWSAVTDNGTVAEIPPGSRTLKLTFPEMKMRHNVMHDPVNQEFILSTELERVEKEVEDSIKNLMDKLRKFGNSEGMQIFKQVLNRTGLDSLIKEAISCIAFNGNFSFNDVRSDVRDFISGAEDFFEAPKKPKMPLAPELYIDIPDFFSIDGKLHEKIRGILIDLLLGIVKGLVESIADLIRETCGQRDLTGGEYGQLNLANMFRVKDAKLNEPDLLGQPRGLNVCFSDFLISQNIGMQYLSDVSGILRPAELCQLLRGTATTFVLDEIANYNSTYAENEIRYNISTQSEVATFFSCLGALVDVSSVCEDILDLITPNLDDICLSEEDILSNVDRDNLNKLLDILQNGLEFDPIDLNLTCPIKPNYIPNPLVDHSIPQLISALVESVASSFYFSADATKSILLEPIMNRNVDANSTLCAAGIDGQGQFDEAEAPDLGPLLEKIQEGLDKLVNGMEEATTATGDLTDQINDYFQSPPDLQAEYPCPDIQDVFGGVENVEILIDMIRSVIESFDFSAVVQLGSDLNNMALGTGAVNISYRFPEIIRLGVSELIPTLNRAIVGGDEIYTFDGSLINDILEVGQRWKFFPAFFGDLSNGAYETYYDRYYNSNSLSVILPPSKEPAAQLKSANTNLFLGEASGVNYQNAESATVYDSSTGTFSVVNAGAPKHVITYRKLWQVQDPHPPSKKHLRSYRFQGPYFLTDPGVSKPTSAVGALYNETEFKDAFGQSAFNTQHAYYNSWELASINPGHGVFASLIHNSLNSFFEDYRYTTLQAEEVVWMSNFYEALQNQYYYSTHAGLIKQLTYYCLENGTFSAGDLLKTTFVKDNTNCDNDPNKIGDLLDLNGIIKRVQQEYDQASCADGLSQRKVVQNCIQYACVLIFMQIFTAQFYLKNVFILSAFKLEELWKNEAIMGFIINSIYTEVDKYFSTGNQSVDIPGGASGSLGDVLTDVIKNYVARKYNRSGLDPRITEALGLQNSEFDILGVDSSGHSYAVKYVLMERMLDSALSMQNVISKDATKSYDQIFVEDVIGFSEPFLNGLESITHVPDYLAMAKNAESDSMVDTLGYGGFKIEKMMVWDKTIFSGTDDKTLYSYDLSQTTQTAASPMSWVDEVRLTDHVNPHEDGGYNSPTGQKFQTSMSLEKMSRWLESGDAEAQPYTITLENLRLEYRLVYYTPMEFTNNDDFNRTATGAEPPKNNFIHKLYDQIFPSSAGTSDEIAQRLINTSEAYMTFSPRHVGTTDLDGYTASDYRSAAIPVFSSVGSSLGDVKIGSQYRSYVTSIAGLQDLNHTQEVLNNSRFNTFFNKVLDKDMVITSVVMNAFWLSEVRFNDDISRVFRNTVDAAADMFTTAVCSPDAGLRNPGPTNIDFLQQNANAPSRAAFNAQGFILKALKEAPIQILKGLCEMLDPHVAVWKIVRDVTGQVFSQLIDAMDTGLATLPPPLNALDIDSKSLLELLFCQLNRELQGLDPLNSPEFQNAQDAMANCVNPGEIPPPVPPGLFPKFGINGIEFTGTLPGLFIPPGPFGLVYLLLNLIPEYSDDSNIADNNTAETGCVDEGDL